MTMPTANPIRRTSPRLGDAGSAGAAYTSSYTALARQIKAAHLLDRRPGSYLIRGAFLAALFGCAVALLIVLGRSWWQLLVAAAFAVLFTQAAFLAHDSAHKQIFATTARGELVSRLLGNLVVGLSYGWWMNKHTRHHANPNTIGRDNDIQPGAVVFVRDDVLVRTGLRRWLTARQGYYFIPILLLAGLDLHVSAIKAIAGGEPVPRRLQEAMLIGLRLAGFAVLVLILLGPGIGSVFLAVQIGVFGLYMGGTFALNHTGMPLIGRDQKVDYLRRQVLSSRNIGGGWPMDKLMGGLNYQIEHHLFPSMPSANLRRARPIVRAYCADLRLPYTEQGFFSAWRLVLRYIHRVGIGAVDPFDCPAARAFRSG